MPPRVYPSHDAGRGPTPIEAVTVRAWLAEEGLLEEVEASSTRRAAAHIEAHEAG